MFLTSCLKSLVLGKFPSNQGTGLGKLPTIPFSMNSSEIHDTQGCITSGLATTCSEYVTDTRYRPRTALDKLTIGVDSVSTAGLEAQIEAVRGGEQVQIREFTSFLDPFRGDMPEEVSF
jgi:hypothetical protein